MASTIDRGKVPEIHPAIAARPGRHAATSRSFRLFPNPTAVCGFPAATTADSHADAHRSTPVSLRCVLPLTDDCAETATTFACCLVTSCGGGEWDPAGRTPPRTNMQRSRRPPPAPDPG